MSTERTTRPGTPCHRCSYDLTGLPAEHRCPECGMAYDARLRAWKPSEPWWPILSAGLLGYWFLSYTAVGWTAYRSVNLLIMLVALVIVLAYLARLFLNYRRGVKLVVGPDGILFQETRRSAWIEWSDVAGVEVAQKSMFPAELERVTVVMNDGARHELKSFFFWRAQAAAFKALAQVRHF